MRRSAVLRLSRSTITALMAMQRPRTEFMNWIMLLEPDIEVSDALVTANFEDQAGNDAPSYKLSYRVSISVAPEAAELSVITSRGGSDPTELDRPKAFPIFNQYRIYRDTSPGVDQTSKLITTITNQNTNSY